MYSIDAANRYVNRTNAQTLRFNAFSPISTAKQLLLTMSTCTFCLCNFLHSCGPIPIRVHVSDNSGVEKAPTVILPGSQGSSKGIDILTVGMIRRSMLSQPSSPALQAIALPHYPCFVVSGHAVDHTVSHLQSYQTSSAARENRCYRQEKLYRHC